MIPIPALNFQEVIVVEVGFGLRDVPNALYHKGEVSQGAGGIFWKKWLGNNKALKGIQMMIRRKDY